MFNTALTTVPADGIAPAGAMISAGTVMIKFALAQLIFAMQFNPNAHILCIWLY